MPPSSKPAPRIPSIPDSALGPPQLVNALRQRRGGSLLNLDRMLLHSPAYAEGWNAFMGAVRSGLSLDARLRELAICTVAVLNRADYEWQQHAPLLLAAGASQAQLDGLRDVDTALHNSATFDPAERAVIELCMQMCRQVQVSDACFARVQAALGTVQQQVELVGIIAAYNMVSRFLEALQVAQE
ncbi:MAG: carboxymuconolactone decarboxylase family protein [Rhodoferax sp.]|nr:carboxymuconolactone decarboxylase family protein [Rhodoferax sp.]